ncbi:hypothetical protein MCUN1_002885 [Malassezia cuniculi]|uniref:DOC domain-containing protein n=1 Tax=Malassezia cuniculi TaxID=948313 RepID=A0AAF0J7S6_9BASI|nr:hypothetical protein MCUN1_002885 [Malassezia cuniculi]
MHDLVDVCYRELFEPQGWYHFFLNKSDPSVPEELDPQLPLSPISVFLVQVCILGNHLNGKDTHIRSLRIFGPPVPVAAPHSTPDPQAENATRAMQRYVEQGMRTAAYRRQVERVGEERAISHLLRIMHKTISMEAILRRQLKQWQRDFRTRHNREPTKHDMQRDPDIAAAYDTWRAFSTEKSKERRSSPKPSSSSQQAQSSSAANPFVSPQKNKDARQLPPTSPSNPFRSPHRESKRVRPTQSPSNPFRSPNKGTKHSLPHNMSHESDMSSDEEEQVLQKGPSPKSTHADAQRPHPVTLTPRKRHSAAAYTPRTKARRMLRGDDVQTPPKRSPRKSILLSPKDVRPGGLFRTNSGQVDELGPSPKKGKPQDTHSFRPMFRTQSAAQLELEDVPDEAMSTSPNLPSSPRQSPKADNVQTDSFEVDGRQISVLPYRRFGSARDIDIRTASDEEHGPDAVEAPDTVQSEPDSPVLQLGGLVLNSPVRHGTRAAAQARARDERMLHGLLEDDDEPPPESFRRMGRSGLDVDEDEAVSDSDEWASEASSADYGWGDGRMDDLDIA